MRGRIDRFQVLGELGRGGFGEVLRAFDPQRGREVAIKVLIRGEAKAARRFEREVAAASRLVHPNVVPSLESGVYQGRPYLVMEFVEGATLESLASGRGRALSPSRAAELLREIARGVAYAHSQGVLHRDIKPANVLVDRAGVARLLDFGLAFLTDSDERLSLTGAMLGTPFFMAPEQAVGRRADERTDVYGLGATLYFSLTGEPPFAESANPLVATHAMPAEAPSKLRPEVPASLDRIVLRAMAKEPAQRQETVEALIAELDAFLRGELEQGAPRRAAALPALSLALTLGAALVGGAWLARTPAAGSARATPSAGPSAPAGELPPPSPAGEGAGEERLAAERALTRRCRELLEAMAPAAALTQPLEEAARAGAGERSLELWRGCQRLLADAEALQRDASHGGPPGPLFQRLDELRRAADQHALLVDRLRLERVRLQLRRGRSEVALRTLRPLRGRFEGAADFLYALALFRLGRWSEGSVELERLGSAGYPFWSTLAQLTMTEGSQASEETQRELLEQHPHPYAPRELELVRLGRAITEESVADARQTLESSLHGDDAYLWCILLARAVRAPGADELLQRIELLCGPDHRPRLYHRSRGLLLLSAGRFAAALESLRQAQPGRTVEVSSMVLEGVALWGLGRLEEAERRWRQAYAKGEGRALEQVSGIGLTTARLAAETALDLPPKEAATALGAAVERATQIAAQFPEAQREALEKTLQATVRGFPFAVIQPLLGRCHAQLSPSPAFRLLEARVLLARCQYARCQEVLRGFEGSALETHTIPLNLRLDLALAREDSAEIDAAVAGLRASSDPADHDAAELWRLWEEEGEQRQALARALALRAERPTQVNLVPITCHLLRRAGRLREAFELADAFFLRFGYLELGFARLRAVLALELGLGGAQVDANFGSLAFRELAVLDRAGDEGAALQLARGAVLTDSQGVWFHSVPYWLYRSGRGQSLGEEGRAVAGAYELRRGASRELVDREWRHVRQPLPEPYLDAYRERFGEDPPGQGR